MYYSRSPFTWESNLITLVTTLQVYMYNITTSHTKRVFKIYLEQGLDILILVKKKERTRYQPTFTFYMSKFKISNYIRIVRIYSFQNIHNTTRFKVFKWSRSLLHSVSTNKCSWNLYPIREIHDKVLNNNTILILWVNRVSTKLTKRWKVLIYLYWNFSSFF